MKKQVVLSALILSVLFALAVPMTYASRGSKPSKPPKPTPTPAMRIPYACGQDICLGYRCVIGDSIRPACYNEAEVAQTACEEGSFVFIPTFNACYETQYYYDWGI